jgi:hypothetical protein
MKPAANRDAGATSGVAVHNRLPSGHAKRLALEAAIRVALAELAGRWDVTLETGGCSLVIAVVAPDGAAWTMSCANPEQRDPEAIAETVKAACSRRRWLRPFPERVESP